MSDATNQPASAEKDAGLTDAEKRLRDWLLTHPEGGEMWLIVKGGFRRSARLALAEAERQLHLNGYRRGGATCPQGPFYALDNAAMNLGIWPVITTPLPPAGGER